jgi:hypothetical protein
MTGAHREDLIRAARAVLNVKPSLVGKLTINENAGTVSDRVTGEVHAFVAPEMSAMGPVEFIGWSAWPRKLLTV